MQTPSLILAADCVYFEPAFPLLVQTLAELVPRNRISGARVEREVPEVLFCYKKRRKVHPRITPSHTFPNQTDRRCRLISDSSRC